MTSSCEELYPRAVPLLECVPNVSEGRRPEVVARLVAAGERPPVYLSANITGGDEHNAELEARYAGRIRRGS